VLQEAVDKVRIHWDSEEHAGVLIRDADTGEVLALGRTGDLVLQTTSRRFELELSNGVSSGPQQVAVPR
jgi:hypothetical protein